MRVTLADGRQLTGTLLAFDKVNYLLINPSLGILAHLLTRIEAHEHCPR